MGSTGIEGSDMTTKDIVMMIKDDLNRIHDQNKKDHKDIKDVLETHLVEYSGFKGRIKATAAIIGSLSGILVTALIRILF